MGTPLLDIQEDDLQWKHTIVVKVNVMLTIEQAMQAERES
jgi:hypothetical protein